MQIIYDNCVWHTNSIYIICSIYNHILSDLDLDHIFCFSMLKNQKAQRDKTQQSNHSTDRQSVGTKSTDSRTNMAGTKRKKPFESNSQSQFKKKKIDGSVKQTDGKFHKHKFNGNTKSKSKNRHDKSSELRQGKRTKKKGFQKNTG